MSTEAPRRVSLSQVPSAPAVPLAQRLEALTVPGHLWEEGPAGRLRCVACAHHCVIEEGRAGACGVRVARGGELRVPFGYVARRYVRSIETNTIFHVRPGSKALTFGMFGCDLRCPYCHNHKVSQALRDHRDDERPVEIDPGTLVEEAVSAGCSAVCAAYNEPMIAAEWVVAVFTEAKRRGLVTAIISDGNTTPEALAFVRPVTDVFRVDLKALDDDQYRVLGGRREPVLAGLREARRLGMWVEVVTLVVPGFNDDLAGLGRLAAELARLDPEMPWHLNAFHPRYRMANRPATPADLLVVAAGSAYARGLRFVYVNNLADQVHELSHTRCPGCLSTVVQRHNYTTTSVELRGAACPRCDTRLPGLWG